jgi:3-deoxy-D-manno-octulosonate 8-phosphate phosphatase (KDO 8-P phosphatase)
MITDIHLELRERARKVKLLLLDVDGVLTDGKIVYDSAGRDLKFFDCHDGMGIHLLKCAGIPTILVTAKSSKAIRPRARDMQVDKVFEGVSPKSAVLEGLLKKYALSKDEICFVGDDLVDLCLMRRVGFPVAVFNAAAEVKNAASYITVREGGKGAVREVAELILKSKGQWQGIIKQKYDL